MDAVLLNGFQPSPFTDMEAMDPPNPLLVAKAMAVTRILMPDIDLIFSHNNEHWGLTAGCNAGLLAGNSRSFAGLNEMREAIYSYRE